MVPAYPWVQQRYLPIAPQHAQYLRTAGTPIAWWTYGLAGLLLVTSFYVGFGVGPHAPLAFMTLGLNIGVAAYTMSIGSAAQRLPKIVATGYFDTQLARKTRRGVLVLWFCAFTQSILAVASFVLGVHFTAKPYEAPIFTYIAVIVVPIITLAYALYAAIAVRGLLTYPGPTP